MVSRKLFPGPLPEISTDRLLLKLPDSGQAPLMVDFRSSNRTFLEPWEPRRPVEFYSNAYWRLQLQRQQRDYRNGTSLCLALMPPDESRIVGVCNYTNIVRGTFQACHLGYALDERLQGQGLMFEALTAANRFVFSELGLNRIMANYLPRNTRSGQLLERLGFVVEGHARRLLQINGRWEDHVLTALLNPAND